MFYDCSVTETNKLSYNTYLKFFTTLNFLDISVLFLTYLHVGFQLLFDYQIGYEILVVTTVILLFIAFVYDAVISFDFSYKKTNYYLGRNPTFFGVRCFFTFVICFVFEIEDAIGYNDTIFINLLVFLMQIYSLIDYLIHYHFLGRSYQIHCTYLICISFLTVESCMSLILNINIAKEKLSIDILSISLPLLLFSIIKRYFDNMATDSKIDSLNLKGSPINLEYRLEKLYDGIINFSLLTQENKTIVRMWWLRHRKQCSQPLCLCFLMENSYSPSLLAKVRSFQQVIYFNTRSLDLIKHSNLKSSINQSRNMSKISTLMKNKQRLKSKPTMISSKGSKSLFKIPSNSSIDEEESDQYLQSSFEGYDINDDEKGRQNEREANEPIYKAILYSLFEKVYSTSESSKNAFSFVASFLSYSLFEMENYPRVFMLCYRYLYSKQVRTSMNPFMKLLISNYLRVAKTKVDMELELSQTKLRTQVFEKIDDFHRNNYQLQTRFTGLLEELHLLYGGLCQQQYKVSELLARGKIIYREKQAISKKFKKLLNVSKKNISLIQKYKMYNKMVSFSSRQEMLDIEDMYQVAKHNAKLEVNNGMSENKKRQMDQFYMDNTYLITSHVKSVNHTVDYYSPGTEKVFGYSKDDFQGLPINMLMSKSIADRHDNFVQDFVNNNNPRTNGNDYSFQIFACHKEGASLSLTTQNIMILSVNQPLSISALIKTDLKKHNRPTAIIWPNGQLEGFNSKFKKVMKLDYVFDRGQDKMIFLMIPALLNIFFEPDRQNSLQDTFQDEDLNYDNDDEILDGEIDCYIFHVNKIHNCEETVSKHLFSLNSLLKKQSQNSVIMSMVSQKEKYNFQKLIYQYYEQNRTSIRNNLPKILVDTRIRLKTIVYKQMELKTIEIVQRLRPSVDSLNYFNFVLKRMNSKFGLLLSSDKSKLQDYRKLLLIFLIRVLIPRR